MKQSQERVLDVMKAERVVSWLAMFFMLLFAFWTIAHHAATFAGIQWRHLCVGAAIAAVPAIIIAAWGGKRFSDLYCAETSLQTSPAGARHISVMVFFVALTAGLVLIPTYKVKFAGAVIGIVASWWLSRNDSSSMEKTSIDDSTVNSQTALWALSAIAVIAVAVTLAMHRSDLDDASFIQIAAQTLRHPDHAPLTFDASLGAVSEPFRFAPYRLCSYETLVAFLAKTTGLDLLTIYYIALPAVAAVLAVAVAYLFSRWFLPHRAAVLATAIFLLITLAWGDSHHAYGNRLFVRLFQGKGLLVALTTPFAALAGLLLLRRPSLRTWAFMLSAQIAAIGVSSTGLVCTFVTTATVLGVAIKRDAKAVVASSLLLITTLMYPIALGLWLKFASSSSVPFREIGTYLPINVSLGTGLRQVLAVTALVLGVGALRAGAARCEYVAVSLAVLLVALNPWLSDLVSEASARNMSWRLAWAAPVPLLVAVAFSAAIYPCFRARCFRTRASGFGSLVAGAALLLFLVGGRWTLASSNKVAWGWPSPTLAVEYGSAERIAAEIHARTSQGTVLASREIAAWLPLVAPDLRVVMPGHTYPSMLQTVLPASDYEARMSLFRAVNGEGASFPDTLNVMKAQHVSLLVVKKASPAEQSFLRPLAEAGVHYTDVADVADHRIIAISYGGSR